MVTILIHLNHNIIISQWFPFIFSIQIKLMTERVERQILKILNTIQYKLYKVI